MEPLDEYDDVISAEKAAEAQRLKEQLLEDIAEHQMAVNERIHVIGKLRPDMGLLVVEDVAQSYYRFWKRVGGPLVDGEEELRS